MFLLFLTTLLLIPQIGYAEEQNDDEDAPLLETVEVTIPSQAERSKSVTIISKHQMEGQHFMNINDVLFSMNPGVTMNRRSNLGFMGGGGATNIRGLDRERVAVFVDGIPQQVNNHFHPLYDSWTPDLIDRIEITRGSSGLLHGASAVGGIIDVFSHIPQTDGLSAYALGSYGRFETKEEQARISYKGDMGYLWVGNTYRKTNGTRFNEDFHANTINVKGVLHLNPVWDVGLRYGSTRATIENPGTVTSPRLARSTQDPTNAAFTLDRRTGTSNSLIAVYWNKAIVDSLRNNGGTPTGTRSFDERELGFRSKHTWLRGPGKTFTVGFDAVTYNDKRTVTGSVLKRTEEFFSPYGAFTWSTGNFLFDGGVRFTESPSYDSDISPEVGVVYKVDNTLALRARWGEGYRVPRAADLSTTTLNPDAAPEEFWEAELGLNKTFGRAVFDIVVWHMQGDNLLVTQVTGPLMGVLANTGEFEHWGVETSLNIRLLDNLTAFVGVAAMDIDDITQVPNQTLDFGLEFLQGPFRATLTSRYAANAKTSATVELPNYYVADLHLGYRMSKYAELFADVDNITNEKYETVTGFPQVSRAVFGGIRINYGQ